MTLDTYTRAQMARFAIEEGLRHGGSQNMMAVALVLRNRVMNGWGDWLEVIETAPAKRGSIYPGGVPDLRAHNVRVFLNRLDEIYTRPEVDDMTGGALFYFEPALPVAPWFEQEVLGYPDDHRRSAHVGPVWFFT